MCNPEWMSRRPRPVLIWDDWLTGIGIIRVVLFCR